MWCHEMPGLVKEVAGVHPLLPEGVTVEGQFHPANTGQFMTQQIQVAYPVTQHGSSCVALETKARSFMRWLLQWGVGPLYHIDV